jgi:hypothetical protein
MVREIGDVTVAALMSKPARTVKLQTTIQELTELMTGHERRGRPAGARHAHRCVQVYLDPYRHAAGERRAIDRRRYHVWE